MGSIEPGVAARIATTSLVDDPPVLPPMPAHDAAPLGSSARDAR
jgi:hypothetical protein